ncbi:glycerol-3-phosphate acyltransferase [Salinisphaera sp. Q1T1-3]|uniref:glycerol-3-phosphate acyltransferase n=1 Tax=Salinisphaera sp. Q1T1-3 TaxID=2321229 RepID=UPI000E7452FA|nr:glycerol-3-phosphate acyltransferase [Salinisphaera sp. Q1T1-3]RJS94048.1 acyl-phosphate glycerol 3-phosphate acyltransferase [Salinisphaera sp. Q1T1-3]
MLEGMAIALALVSAYLIGSFSGALVLAPVFGVSDVRDRGSGNAGATNAWRVGGRAYGGAVLAFDAVKGAVAAGFVSGLIAPDLPWPYACGWLAIAGHVWPVFHRFRGGKGAATAVGVFAILLPLALVVGCLVFAVLLAWRRIVSVATLGGGAACVLSACLVPGLPAAASGLAVCAFALIVYTHRPNLQRLAAGTEPRLARRDGHKVSQRCP